MAKTEIAEYTFTVKEGSPPESGGEAPAYLMCEPKGRDLSILGRNRLGRNKFLTIELLPGTSVDRAQEIADSLNENVAGIGVTVDLHRKVTRDLH
jgi:hypothetical protein